MAWRSASPPPSFIDLSSKLKLLDYFVRYMDENLAEGVILSLCANQMRVSTRHRSVIPQVVRWTRNQSAVIMELNNGNISVFKGGLFRGCFLRGSSFKRGGNTVEPLKGIQDKHIVA